MLTPLIGPLSSPKPTRPSSQAAPKQRSTAARLVARPKTPTGNGLASTLVVHSQGVTQSCTDRAKPVIGTATASTSSRVAAWLRRQRVARPLKRPTSVKATLTRRGPRATVAKPARPAPQTPRLLCSKVLGPVIGPRPTWSAKVYSRLIAPEPLLGLGGKKRGFDSRLSSSDFGLSRL